MTADRGEPDTPCESVVLAALSGSLVLTSRTLLIERFTSSGSFGSAYSPTRNDRSGNDNDQPGRAGPLMVSCEFCEKCSQQSTDHSRPNPCNRRVLTGFGDAQTQRHER
jgi:hypothetical protein